MNRCRNLSVIDPGTKFIVNDRYKNFELVLSIFHGADLFGRGFENLGYCVVRAGELQLNFDIRDFHAPAGKFDGIIAGSPCQDFSRANRTKRSYNGYGKKMIQEFLRIVTEAQPNWFLLENVPSVPNVICSGYKIQRFDLNASECGLTQSRLRHFQFGCKDGHFLIIDRQKPLENLEPCVTVNEFAKKKVRRTFESFCRLQGLPDDFDLPAFKLSEKYKAVANGVPLPMAERIAAAICDRATAKKRELSAKICPCGCGRILTGKQKSATAACRKRLQFKREKALKFISVEM